MHPSIQSFAAFVHYQPADKPINHSSWETCAVGDWAEYMTGSRGPSRRLSCDLERVFNHAGDNLREVLGCYEVYDEEMPNYGSLQMLLVRDFGLQPT
jgi:hypothetical protein